MSTNPYKNLNLNRATLNDFILSYCIENCIAEDSFNPIHQVNGKSIQQRAEIKLGKRTVRIDFYYCGDGTTTISPDKNDDQSIAIADYIKDNAKTTDKKNDWLVIRDLKNDTLELLIEFINELGVELTHKDIRKSEYKLWQYKSKKYQDNVTIKYYDNNTFMLQGKPLFLYNEIMSFLSEYIPLKETLKSSVFYSISLDTKKLLKSTEEYLPNSYKCFNEDVKNMIATSVAYMEININLPEYSSWSMPILKALDFYIRTIIKNKLNITTINNYGDIFDYDNNTKLHHLKTSYVKMVNSKTKNALERCYQKLKQERHSSFHVNLEEGMMRVIDTREDAVKIIQEVLELIETTYNDVN